jgi:hypothetical protein
MHKGYIRYDLYVKNHCELYGEDKRAYRKRTNSYANSYFFTEGYC